jgi:hypothetical protein
MRGFLAIRIQEDEHYIIKVSLPSMVFFFFLGYNEEVNLSEIGNDLLQTCGILGSLYLLRCCLCLLGL